MSLFPLGLLSQGGGAGGGGAFEQIATVAGDGSSYDIAFSSIPATYKHLQIRFVMVMTNNVQGNPFMRINGDSGGNYSMHWLRGNGAALSSLGYANWGQINLLGEAGVTTTLPTVGIINILNYADTNTFKTVRTLAGTNNATKNELAFSSGNWRSTSAITSIGFQAGDPFATTTRISLYGIKG